MTEDYSSALVGTSIAWFIAFGSVVLFALLSRLGKFRVAQETKVRLDILAAVSLTFIAVNIISPFPFLNQRLDTVVLGSPSAGSYLSLLTLKDAFVVLLAIGGLVAAFVTTRNKLPLQPDQVDDVEGPTHFLRLMTWLPPALQVWILVAGSTTFVEPSGILASGLFVLAGPGAWQFAIFLMSMPSTSIRSGLIQITRIMIVSLALTLGFATFGVWIGQLSSQGGALQIQGAILPYAAAFSLVIVSYFFFYSFWGEKWHESRPIATVAAITLFALIVSVRLANSTNQLVFVTVGWTLIVAFPFVFYNREYVGKLVQCPECRRNQAHSIHGPISLWKSRYGCSVHTQTSMTVSEERYLQNICMVRWLILLLEGFYFTPRKKDFSTTLTPNKLNFRPQEPYTLTVHITNRMKHATMAVVEVIWRGRLGRISESKVDTIELLQGQTMDIPINSLIPNIAWRPKDPASHQERITIDVRVRTVAYYPFASPLQFPFAPPRRKRLELIVERP